MARKHLHGQRPGNDEWETPRDFFAALNGIFHFGVDAAASETNHLLDRYWTNAQGEDWSGERVYCNPPYSRIGEFVGMARAAELAVFLLPSFCITTDYIHRNAPLFWAIPENRIHYRAAPACFAVGLYPELGGLPLYTGETSSPFGSLLALYGGVRATHLKLLRSRLRMLVYQFRP